MRFGGEIRPRNEVRWKREREREKTRGSVEKKWGFLKKYMMLIIIQLIYHDYCLS